MPRTLSGKTTMSWRWTTQLLCISVRHRNTFSKEEATEYWSLSRIFEIFVNILLYCFWFLVEWNLNHRAIFLYEEQWIIKYYPEDRKLRIDSKNKTLTINWHHTPITHQDDINRTHLHTSSDEPEGSGVHPEIFPMKAERLLEDINVYDVILICQWWKLFYG